MIPARVNRLIILMIPVLGGFSAGVRGESPAGSPLETLVGTALKSNPGLRAQRERISARRLAPVQAGALPDPAAEVELMGFEIPKFKPWQTFSSGINLGYTQMLPAAGKRRAAREAAQREVELEEARLAVMESELRGQVVAAAYRLATIRKLLAIKDEEQQALEASVQVVTAAYSVGRGNQAEVLLAQQEITRIPVERQELLQQEAVTIARLDSLSGEPASLELLARTVLPEPFALPPLASLLQELEEKAPAVRLAKTGEYVQEGQVELAKKNFKPDWMIGAGARIRDMSMGGASFLTFKIGFTLPFMHHRDRYVPALEESLRLRDSVRYETSQTIISARYQLTEAYASATRSQRTHDLYQHGLLLQARLTYESNLAAYSAQQADFNSLIQALNSFYKFQGDLIMIRGDFQEARAMMEAILGHPPGPGASTAAGSIPAAGQNRAIPEIKE